LENPSRDLEVFLWHSDYWIPATLAKTGPYVPEETKLIGIDYYPSDRGKDYRSSRLYQEPK
jgi:hypothetical protein